MSKLHFGDELNLKEETVGASKTVATRGSKKGLGDEYKVESEYALDNLDPETRAEVEEFVRTIDLNKTNAVLTYGQGPQKKVSGITTRVTEATRTKDSGEASEMLLALVSELKDLGVEDKNNLWGKLFGTKFSKKVQNYKIKYESVEGNLDTIVADLESHKVNLIRDIHVLDDLYDVNKEHVYELGKYIAAGEEKLRQYYEIDIANKRRELDNSNNQMAAHELQDMLNKAGRFEQRLHDLKLSRTVCIQFAPQIRVIQNNDNALLEKIQSTVANAIPIWRTNILIGMGLENSKKAVTAQKAVADMTNDLLKQNAALLKQSSIEIAQQTQRGLIDIETIQTVNSNLIETLTEVIDIQKTGITQRREIETQITGLETELKNKLIDTVDEQRKLYADAEQKIALGSR